MKRLIVMLFATFVSALIAPGLGLAAEPQAGRDFKVVNPPLPTPKGKIEVVEFFSYGCPHCSAFHPLISQWAAKLPKDVSLRRSPVTFNRPAWALLSRLYFALDTTGDLAKLDGAVFAAIHEQRMVFRNDQDVTSWAATKGADAKKLGDALNSFSMQSRVLRADQDAAAAHIGGVPSLLVDGRYLISSEAAASFEELLKLTDAVIAKARQEHSGK